MSFLNSSTNVLTKQILAPHITKDQVLALLHDSDKMLDLNPIIRSHTLLDDPRSKAFFKHVEPENKPPATGEMDVVPVYQIIEGMGVGTAEAGSWRGGWAKKFIPDTITYQTSMQNTDNGMVTITHAPMGVYSVTRWIVKDSGEGNVGLILEKTGKVTSNRMLMGFIKTTLQDSYDKLVQYFLTELERQVSAANQTGGDMVTEKVT